MNCKDFNAKCLACKIIENYSNDFSLSKEEDCWVIYFHNELKAISDKYDFKDYIINILNVSEIYINIEEYIFYIKIVVENYYPQYTDTMNKILLLK